MKRLLLGALFAAIASIFPYWVYAEQHRVDPTAPRSALPRRGAEPAKGAPGHAVRPTEHAAAGEASTHGGHVEEAHELSPINWTDFGKPEQPPYIAMLVNFGLLMALYVYFGKKPISAALKERRDSVAKEIEEAARLKAEAEQRAKVYQAKLDTLEEELKTARAALLEVGKGERDRMVFEAEEKAARMKRDAEFLVLQEKKQLEQDLRREMVEAAIATAEELLKKRITLSDQERIAEDYLATLKPSPGGVSPRGSTAPGGAS